MCLVNHALLSGRKSSLQRETALSGRFHMSSPAMPMQLIMRPPKCSAQEASMAVCRLRAASPTGMMPLKKRRHMLWLSTLTKSAPLRARKLLSVW